MDLRPRLPRRLRRLRLERQPRLGVLSQVRARERQTQFVTRKN